MQSVCGRALVGMMMYNAETKEIAKPTELLNSIKAIMNVLQSIENYGTTIITLRTFLPPKCHFSLVKKCKTSSEILPQIPNFTNFVKNEYCHRDGQFSSFRQFFVKNEILWS